nr:hypothetical protein [Leptospiraceae bacterium]
QNNKVRKIVIATAAVNTFAGPAQGTTTFGDTDGALTTARFGGPTGILKTGTNLYVTDSSTNKIRKISL